MQTEGDSEEYVGKAMKDEASAARMGTMFEIACLRLEPLESNWSF